jgi:hypothetical protein
MTKRAVCILLFVIAAFTASNCEEVSKVSLCQIKSDPAAFNHKLVEVTGFVSHDFEDFTVFDPTCDSWQDIWLEYGGKAASGTTYCCGGTTSRKRSQELVVENIQIPLVKNQPFDELEKAIQPPFRSGRHGAIIRATVVGRFFAGKKMKSARGDMWVGYGHMGCCSLLAIREIKSVDTEDRIDLDYGASADQPDIEKTGCGYKFLIPFDGRLGSILDQQRQADAGDHAWVFDDPQRVAVDTLTRTANLDVTSGKEIRLVREAEGRKVYQLQIPAQDKAYMVVVSRPYWLSFSAKTSDRVAWVALAAYESPCGKPNAVTRIR